MFSHGSHPETLATQIHPKELSGEIKQSLSTINEMYKEYYKKKALEEQLTKRKGNSNVLRRRLDMIIKHLTGHSLNSPKIQENNTTLHSSPLNHRDALTPRILPILLRASKKSLILLILLGGIVWIFYKKIKFNSITNNNRITERMAVKKITKHFSLIEILIAISIMVTFSGMTSIVYNDKLIESKIAYTRIELNLILQHVYLYYTTHGRYPVSLNDIENIKTIASFEDRWNQPYIYIPYIDWVLIIELLQKSNVDEREVNYQLECLQALINGIVSSNQTDIDPRIILVESSQRPLLFSFGYRKPIFADSFDESISTSSNEFRERIQLVAQWIKIAREKSVGLLRFQNTIQQLQNQLGHKEV
ncbi:hypothetical protein C9374_011331 [Naegleria lovaniensis]|uniref:Uncharacterized protein n=1 Tax=Naegleria lovaniensis TaxID=51637 RepID=A0AA88H4A7_NAELO|nr:uncharacterized protein C9374_011331 [Naegleria lovaniensis]KAG2392606.1 hypothetical protein C9374_011331 [Naegleria lovaniensis]